MSREIGIIGEDIACKILIDMGYVIVERNYHSKFGEIDIIARLDTKIIFVEVKYKEDQGYGLPQEAVTRQKIRKIIKTARYYLHESELSETDWQIDVLAIAKEKGSYNLIENIYIEGLS
ncbi:MAG: YraN family protein [Patescibacteria group bacterium]|nr:YraN family protein [Patescibacteria group bacterium]